MSQNRNNSADEVFTLVNTGQCLLRSVIVRQHTIDAPKLFLQFFDDASPTVGTDAPSHVLEVPPGLVGQANELRYVINGSQGGMLFGTALSYAVTTAYNTVGAPSAGDEPEVVVDYHPMT